MNVRTLCSNLVKINSENPPGETADIIEYISSVLLGLGLNPEIIKASKDHHNVLAGDKDANLLLCGHVDVVPAIANDWTYSPLSGFDDGTDIWGRGATDMKGGCAAIISACEDIVNSDLPELGARLAFVCDEETNGACGIQYCIKKSLIQPCDCIIAEPSLPLHPQTGQKGLCRFTIHFSGKPGHGSLYPFVGESAIMNAHSFLSYCSGLSNKIYSAGEEVDLLIEQSSKVFGELRSLPRSSSLLKRIMWNPGKIEGGEKSNIVAEHCDMELEMRIPWGCDIECIIKDLKSHAHNAVIEEKSIYGPSITSPDADIVKRTCAAVSEVFNKPSFPVVQFAASDARYLRKSGFSVIEYGPGYLDKLHAIDEKVSVESLNNAKSVYKNVIRSYYSGD